MRLLLFLWLALGFVFLELQVFAQEKGEFKQLIQEFNFSQPVYPQERNELQVSPTSFLLRKKENHDFDLGFGFEYGLTNRLQLEAEFVDLVVKPRNIDEAGHRNYSINTGALYNFINRSGFSASLVMEFQFPVRKIADDSVSVEYEPQLILAKQIGKGQFQISGGVEAQTKATEYFYNLAYVFPFGNWKPILELNGAYEEDSEIFISPGLVWNGYKTLEVVTGATFGMGQDNKSWGVSLKVVYEFTLLHKSSKPD